MLRNNRGSEQQGHNEYETNYGEEMFLISGYKVLFITSIPVTYETMLGIVWHSMAS